ncbi:MAG: hypothetical protein CSA54_01730, partial [Gammaproteobacteria bacterium]
TVADGTGAAGLFQLAQSATLRLEARVTGSGDPVLTLFSQDGELIHADDDSGGNGDAFMEVPLSPGAYCALLTSYDDTPLEGTIRLGQLTHAQLTHGAGEPEGCDAESDAELLAEGALDLSADEGLQRMVSVSRMPRFRFTLDEPQRLILRAENQQADPVLSLYDAAGNLLFENDDANGYNAEIVVDEPLPAGDYCLKVGAVGNDALGIRLTLQRHSEKAMLEKLYRSGEASPVIDGDFPIDALGSLKARQTIMSIVDEGFRWYAFDMSARSYLLADAIGLGRVDPALVLYSDTGERLAQNDDRGSGVTDARILTELVPGRYLIGVGLVRDGKGMVRVNLKRLVEMSD